MPFINKIKTLIQRIYKNLQPDHIILNNSDRNLKNRHLSYNVKNINKYSALYISGEIKTPGQNANKAAIISICFYSASGKKIQSDDSIPDFSNSSKFGSYKYLSGKEIGEPFIIIIPLPQGTFSAVLKIHAKNSIEALLSGGAKIHRIDAKKSDLLNRFIFSMEENLIDKTKIDRKHIDKIIPTETTSRTRAYLLKGAFEHFRKRDPAISFAIGINFWKELNDISIERELKILLTSSGRMRELRDFLDQVDLARHPNSPPHSSRRIADEINKLENGFFLPKRSEHPNYEKEKSIIYILHNSLPYNSGGYATRTQGILKGILDHTEYRPVGLSRPGYPSDHQKHISNKLPNQIPECDDVNGITYFRSTQNLRKSTLTITEYISLFSEEIEKYAKINKVSVIHAASNFPNGIASNVAARRLGIASVYEVRGLWEITRLSRQPDWNTTEQYAYMAKMEAEACLGADAVFTLTHALKNLMIQRGVPSEKITVLPNCVNTKQFAPLVRDRQLAAELNISENDIVIGYVGSIVEYEGIDLLIDALSTLYANGVDNFKLILVGDGAELNNLKNLIKQKNLQDKAIVVGRVSHDEVQRYYSLIDITPFPRKPYSVCEIVSPLKPFEAMASQKAVIVSSCAALTEIVNDGINGLVFEKGNTGDLTEKLHKLIADNDLRSNISLNGRNWVIAERDWKNAAEIIERTYDSIYTK